MNKNKKNKNKNNKNKNNKNKYNNKNNNNNNNNLICIAPECQRLQRRWRTDSLIKISLYTKHT